MGGLWSCVSDLARWVTWFADAFPPRDGDDAGPLRRASRREMQQVQRSWPTEHTVASGEGDESVPERIDGGGYGFGLFVPTTPGSGTSSTHSGGSARLRVEHAVAPWPRRRRHRARQRDLRADVDDGPTGCWRSSTSTASSPAHRARRARPCSMRRTDLAALLSDWTDSAAE